MRKADNLPPSCAVVMKSGNLNFLEPSGPLPGLFYIFYCFIYLKFSPYLGLVLSVSIVYLPILVKYRIEIYNFCPSPHPYHMFGIMLVCVLLFFKKIKDCDDLMSYSYTLYCTK